MTEEEYGLDDNGRLLRSVNLTRDLPLDVRKVTAGHELVKTIANPKLPGVVRWQCICGAEADSITDTVGTDYQNHLPDMPRVVRPESPVRPDRPAEPELSTETLQFFDVGNEEPTVIALLPPSVSSEPNSGRNFFWFQRARSYRYLTGKGKRVYYPDKTYNQLYVMNVRMAWEEDVEVMSAEDAHTQLQKSLVNALRW